MGAQSCYVKSFDNQFLYSKQWFGGVGFYEYTLLRSKMKLQLLIC